MSSYKNSKDRLPQELKTGDLNGHLKILKKLHNENIWLRNFDSMLKMIDWYMKFGAQILVICLTYNMSDIQQIIQT